MIFKFQKGDLVSYRLVSSKMEFTDVVNFVKEHQNHDMICCNLGFLMVDDRLTGDCGACELLEVFRRDGDIYKKVF